MKTSFKSFRFFDRGNFALNLRSEIALVLLVAFPAVQIFSSKSLPLAMLVAVLLVCIFLAFEASVGDIGTAFPRVRPPVPVAPLVIASVLFIAWCAASLFWSPRPSDGMKDISLVLSAAGAGYFLAHYLKGRKWIGLSGFAACGMIVAAPLLVAIYVFDQPLFTWLGSGNTILDVNRSVALLAGVVVVVSAFPPRLHPVLRYLPVIGALIAVFVSRNQSAQLSVMAALAAFALIRFWPRLRLAFHVLLCVTLLGFPFILSPIERAIDAIDHPITQAGSMDTRLTFWTAYRDLAMKRPLFGWGAKADREFGVKGMLTDDPSSPIIGPPSPHNFILEIWTNFGLVGAALLSAVILSLYRSSASYSLAGRAGCTALIVYCFGYSSTSSSVTQGWWLFTIALLAATLVAMEHEEPSVFDRHRARAVDA